MTYFKYLPKQISFNMDEGSTQLDLILIYENEGDGLIAFNSLKFQNHVNLIITTTPNSKQIVNIEFKEQGGQDVFLSQVLCDKRSLGVVQDRFDFVNSATLSFYEPKVVNNKKILQIIEFYVSGVALQKATSKIQSCKSSLNIS